jgi:hypothetical protein
MREATAQGERATAELARLRDINVQLGERVVHADTTLLVLLDNLKALSTLDRAELQRALLRLLVEVLHVEAASLWEVSGKSLVRRASTGATPPSLALPPQRRFGGREVIAAHELPDAERPRGMPLYLARIRAGASGPVVGYLAIERLPLRATAECARLLPSLVEWLSLATGNALAYENAERLRAQVAR